MIKKIKLFLLCIVTASFAKLFEQSTSNKKQSWVWYFKEHRKQSKEL